MIQQITWQEIQEVWSTYLWPDRSSPIQTHSAMCFLGDHNMYNKTTRVTFLGYYIDGKLCGVNSGHGCAEVPVYGNNYRSRGLFVHEKYRGRGIGTALLLATIEQARTENYKSVWSYPKNTSWDTYNRAGFTLASAWHDSETGTNAYAYCIL